MHVQLSIHLTLICILLVAYADEAISLCDTWNSPSFRQHLENNFVKAGENASFTCVVANFNSESDQLSWHIGPDLQKKKVIEKYAADIQEFSSTIIAFTVTATNFFFSCTVDYLPRLGEGDLLQSSDLCRIVSKATLTVNYFPDATDLKCNPLHPLELRPGDVLPVRCEVPRCEPAVNLVWKFNDSSRGRLPRPRVYNVGLIRVLSHDLVVQKNHHLSTIICVVTSRVSFPSEKLECRIGPLRVFQSPNVSVHPQHIEVSEGDSFRMNCRTSSFPEVTTFAWSCSPGGVLMGCNSTSGTITLLAENIAFDANVTVSCAATNSEGTNASNANVSVLKYVERQAPVADEAEVYALELSILQNVSAGCVALSCSVFPNTTRDTFDFYWLIDGLPVSSDFIPEQGGPHGKSSLVVLDEKYLKTNFRVTCGVNTSGIITKKSRNASISTLLKSTAKKLNAQTCELYEIKVSTEAVEINRALSTVSDNDVGIDSKIVVAKKKDYILESFKKSNRTFILITIGVIVVFLTILFSIALVFTFVDKYFCKRRYGNFATGLQGNKPGVSKEESEDHSSSDVYSGCDPIYETPSFPSALPNMDCRLCSQEHTYSTAVLPGTQPSRECSPEISPLSSSPYCSTGDNDSVFLEHEYADSINMVVYDNQSVVEMQRLRVRDSAFPPRQSRQQCFKECMTVPVPSLPVSNKR